MSDSALLQGATLVNAKGETRAGEELGAAGRVLALYFAVRSSTTGRECARRAERPYLRCCFHLRLCA